ncbi:hypothetical protein QE152_g27565 [Popillia japonica]|uniref:Uncharacterized protein n=1 Tax=Popillia japonica TaxID=7064 RepID=A0AAW1JVZ0_POPJA
MLKKIWLHSPLKRRNRKTNISAFLKCGALHFEIDMEYVRNRNYIMLWPKHPSENEPITITEHTINGITEETTHVVIHTRRMGILRLDFATEAIRDAAVQLLRQLTRNNSSDSNYGTSSPEGITD